MPHCPTVYLFFPETNGRPLEEMDAIFAQSKSIFDPPKIARTMPRRRLVDEIAANGGSLSGEKMADMVQNIENTATKSFAELES